MMSERSSPSGDELLLLHALVDGELDAADGLVLERRIAADPTLAAEYERVVAVKDSVARVERPVVSAELTARIMAMTGSRPVSRAHGRPRFLEGWRAIAASVVVAAALASGATLLLLEEPTGFSVEDAVAGSHRRSLLAVNPVDIASSDRHTVKPWLDAKLGVSPPAPDLGSEGFALVGGRVDVLGADPVPALVYRHNEHLISVLAVPGAHSETVPAAKVAGGYNMVSWARGGFSFWAVSDLETKELQGFVADYRSN